MSVSSVGDNATLSPALVKAARIYRRAAAALEAYVAPVFDLAVRLWIANIFFTSGRQKIGDWESTLYLFAEEYKVPLLPPEPAAYLATAFELVMPALLVLGLAARLAALPLLAMAVTIQFALGATNPAYDNVQHFYWMFLLALIVVRGPGKLSLDHLICRQLERRGLL
jgi:putative oxidoreductase